MTEGSPPPSAGRTEIWLHTNRRALGVALAVVMLFGAAGVSAVFLAVPPPLVLAVRIAGGVTLVACAYLALSLVYQMTVPRIAYRQGHLLVYLRSAAPTCVPIEIVELFFAGQGSSHLPVAADTPAKARTVVVRLAENATDWHYRDVKLAWGEWREGYIILRGTWCEPLTPDVLRRLNRRLREVHRDRQGQPTETPA